MKYHVVLSKPAQAFFERAGAGLQRRLDRCFKQVADDPRRHSNIRALSGPLSGCWRYRLGDYRIVYRIEDDNQLVVILVIAHRRDVYG